MLYAVVLCLLLAALLTVLALRRPDSRRREWRLLAGLLAAGGLGLAGWPPRSVQLTPTPTTAILLTEGYSSDTLRRLVRQLGPTVPVWRYAALASPDTPTFRNPAALGQQLPGLRELHVLGRGLPPADVALLPPLALHVHTDALATGFVAADWQQEPELGQPWAVEGQYNSATAEPVRVRLLAAGRPRDSVQLPAGRGRFRLSFRPKAAGRAVYTLEAAGPAGRVTREPVPVQVLPNRPLRVLLLAATPSFEVRFLKNDLAAHQHAVALRTGLSRGLTQTEFLNLPNPPNLNRLTPTLLNRFQVLLTDAASLADLSAAEAAAVRRAVQSGQLGVLLLADAASTPRQLPGTGAFRLRTRPVAATGTAQRLTWPGGPAATALVPATLTTRPDVRPLIIGPNREPVAAVLRLGAGQVAVTTIIETFPWLLQQQADTYAAYWSHLLTAVRPARAVPVSVLPLATWPRPDAPLTLRATGPARGPLLVQTATTPPVRVALRQDASVGEWATATYWPAAPGWHEARLDSVRQWFYVYDSVSWQAPARADWHLAAAQSSASPATALAATSSHVTTWPRWWGYVLFLLGAGLLWLEEKL